MQLTTLLLLLIFSLQTMSLRVSIRAGNSPGAVTDGVPVATPVEGNVITVNDDKVAALIAEERIKEMKERQAKEDKELKRVTDEQVQTQRELRAAALKQQAESAAAEETRKRMKWRDDNPSAAMEEDRVHKAKVDEERRKLDDASRRENDRRVADALAYAKRISADADSELKLAEVNRQKFADKLKAAGYALTGMGIGFIILASKM